MFKRIGIASLLLAAAGCASQHEATLIGPTGALSPQWTEADLAKPYAVTELFRTELASHHVVRLAAAEKPHVHDTHDGSVFILSGTARVHLGDEVHDLSAGDTLFIPHGQLHWAQNTGRDPAMAYVIFTPPFDGKDIRPVQAK